MSLGNLSIKVSADVGAFTTSMDLASKAAQTGMNSSAASVDDFRDSLLQASADLQNAALAMSSNMRAANDVIVSTSKESADSIQNIATTAENTDFRTMGEKIGEAIGTGVGVGIVAAQGAWNGFVEYSKVKAAVVGVAVASIFAAVGLGAIYTAYKVITGSMDFIIGLLTGDSYKSQDIDALIKANDEVKEIQKSLMVTAQQASATNAAIAAIGIDKKEYLTTFEKARDAIHSNVEELDRLGVSHKSENDLIQSANAVLDKYTEGWDRNQAAIAIGIGSASAVAAAASLTTDKISEAGDRLNDYNLGIGTDTQAAVKRYQDAMRDFNRETDLTSQGFKRAWADQIMPILTDLAEFFKDGFPIAVNAFRYSMATITSLFYGLKEVAYIVSESVIGGISAMIPLLGGVGEALSRIMSGDFTGAKDALVRGWDEAQIRLGKTGDNIVAQSRHNADAMRQAWAMDDRNQPGIEKAKKGDSWTPKPKDDDTSATTDPFKTAIDSLGATRAGIDYVNQHFDEYQGKVKESKTAMADFDLTLGKFSDTQRKSQGFEPLIASQKAQYMEMNKAIEEGTELERQQTVIRKFNKSVEQFGFSEQQGLDARKQDVEWLGKSQIELAKLTDARRIDAEVSQIIFTTNAELGLQGKKITDEQIAGFYAKADAAKSASAVLIQQAYDKQKDPWFGASQAIQKYGETANNVGAQIENSLTNAFKNAEDAFVQFAMTGKLSFTNMANSIIADLIRIQARKAIAGFIDQAVGFVTGSFGGTGSGITDNAAPSSGAFTAAGDFGLAGARALGGPVASGSSYLVGERGPEIFTPAAGGTIIPNDKLNGNAGGGDVYVTVNADTGASQTTGKDGDMRKLGEMIGAKVREVIVTERRNGGLLSA